MNNNNSLSEQLGGLLRSKGLLMGTAESCTGGRIANMVTLVAGSSDYFVGGVVSYSNEVKHNVLGVSEDSLRLHGAVSRGTDGAGSYPYVGMRLLGGDVGSCRTGRGKSRKTGRNGLDRCRFEGTGRFTLLSFRYGAG